MSRIAILAIYVVVDLLIVGGVIYAAFAHVPLRQFFLPATMLFVLNGGWLIWMTIRKTPPGGDAP
jgi:hypothetical protein